MTRLCCTSVCLALLQLVRKSIAKFINQHLNKGTCYFPSFPVVSLLQYLSVSLLNFTMSQCIPSPFLLLSFITENLWRETIIPCCPSEQSITALKFFLCNLHNYFFNLELWTTCIQILQSTYHYLFSSLNLQVDS